MTTLFTRIANQLRDVTARHHERYRPTGCGFAVADQINLLDAATWDQATTGASVLLQRPYLSALAASAPSDVAHRFALITNKERVLGAVVCQLVTISGTRLHGEVKGRLDSLRKAGLDRLRIRTLVCGNLWTWGNHGVAIAPDVNPDEVWPAVGELLYRIRRSEALDSDPGMVVVKDLPSSLDVTGLRRLSYRPVETEPDMELNFHGGIKTFADYLGKLQAKYRKQIRDVTREIEEHGLQTSVITDMDREADRMHELYLQVQARAAIRPVTTTAAYLPSISSALGENHFRATGVRTASGELVGFVTSIKDGETVIAYQVGFDAQIHAQVPLYFHLMHTAIADALILGGKRISFGRTALEVKARLGAKPQPLSVWTRHRRQPINMLMRPWLGLVRHDQAPERHPFKADS